MRHLHESLLRPLPPFSQLADAQIRTILDHASSRGVGPGQTVFAEGDPAETFYLLLDGTIRVVRISSDGEQVTSLHIPPGQLFGIARALGRDHYPATAVAASEALMLCWSTSLWDSFIVDYPGFATETYKTVGARIGEMNARIMEMSTQHVEQRVARALLRLINQSGIKVAQGIEIGFPITRQDVSELTGTTLHTVSRLLSAWEKDGMVSSKRKKITICDPHRLMLLSDP
ncbi:Crp/Fnr family transcriptional regulator [Phaeobacter inhibens]|uniref:Crp/Fnr family transcriptional regulator n=1 Tax=Phaeobacter inhibens TaxID=221822 RepID=UPI000CA1E2EA|nr:Crp/Fnr family transcriptional regulator [Phaeobacter inhibens]AUQ64675.1 transcriptional regulator, crp family [Phaeobacter inhibens]AUQ84513.1 transcriptional regulator, crp family [Phaeobacter inhibens]AUQ92322.1 transcriptional regulator, crp family [Phaeobacter inhibens]MDO6758159.1 Crp/Fnr family transcriptional regulator [Phaeobacter inhibens]